MGRSLAAIWTVLGVALAASAAPPRLEAAQASVAATAPDEPPPTRAALLRGERERKAATRHAYEPGRLERWVLAVENGRWVERLLLADGFYPRIGTLAPASGVAVGGGYRARRWWSRRVSVTAGGAVSPRGYWVLEAQATASQHRGSRAFVDLSARRGHYPEEDFFGLGPDSRRGDRVKFAYRETRLGVTAGVRPTSWLTVGAATSHLAPRVAPVVGARFPSIETRFGGEEAPGLFARPTFWDQQAFVELNWREPRGSPRRGGRYRAVYHAFVDRTGGRFGFRRLDVDAEQYLAAFHDRRGLALRARGSFSDADPGAVVPFYLQETLGGPSTLRGFRSYRFRDRQLLLLQGEYRWEIFPALDGAIFYDAGMVAPRRRVLSLERLRHDYGIGFRFGTRQGVFLRIDAAFGSRDGPHLYAVFDHVF
jgi:hypothetical protein